MGERDDKSFRKTVATKTTVSPSLAEQYAKALKSWAHEKGVTHFSHSFYPLSGASAGKQNAFLEPEKGSQEVLEHLSGKDLSINETDGSSFPNGGSRITHEARAYCVWDPSSSPYILDAHGDRVLYIPSVFFGWNGFLLDKRITLLRSEEYLGDAVRRTLRALGLNDQQTVQSDCGLEQEFFLIDRKMYLERQDLRMCGRTLFGRGAAKHQQLSDHYYSDLGERTEALDEMSHELWKLGIPVKQRHKEVAPCQYEMAPVFTQGTVATNHNLMMMRLMSDVARKHNLECIFHEKPFQGINGTARHNNWSVKTCDYPTIFWPNKVDNNLFLVACAAMVRAIAQNGDLLRFSAAGAGNDYRLGGHEAPPAIISLYMGEPVTAILEDVMAGRDPDFGSEERSIDIDVRVNLLPEFHVANHDRNRTSPVAFTTNKFEFRACGGPQSAADHSYMLNTIFADSLDRIAEQIEKAGTENARDVIAGVLRENFHAIFNGDGYSEEWPIEAKRRGLPNLKTTPDAIAAFNTEKNKAVFERTRVLTGEEMDMIQHVNYENYNTTIDIEAQTSLELLNRKIIPAGMGYTRIVSGATANESKESNNVAHLNRIQDALSKVTGATSNLQQKHNDISSISDDKKIAEYNRDTLIPAMNEARVAADNLEGLVPESEWPLPSYTEILWSEDIM